MQSSISTLPGRGPLVVTCAECPNQFRVFPSTLKYRPHPTCSRACYGKRQTRVAVETNSRPCVVCGKPFYDTPGAFEKEGRKACGLECRAIWQTGRRSDPTKRYWAYVTKSDVCWPWIGAAAESDHGRFWNGERYMPASHFAWWLATGHWPQPGEFVCHDCPDGDNPACVRNDEPGIHIVKGAEYPQFGHLWLGDHDANMADMVAKGRSAHNANGLPGARNPKAKLTEKDVLFVLVELEAGVPPRELADLLGVTPNLIRQIGARKIWKHVAYPAARTLP